MKRAPAAEARREPLAWESRLVWIRSDLRGGAEYLASRNVLYHAKTPCGSRFGRSRSFNGKPPYVQVTVFDAHERGVFACPACAPDLRRFEAEQGLVDGQVFARIRDRQLTGQVHVAAQPAPAGGVSGDELVRRLANKGALRMIGGLPHCMVCPSQIVVQGTTLRCPEGHFQYGVQTT